MISEKEKSLQNICNAEAPSRPFSILWQSSNFTPAYKQPKVGVMTRSLNVLGIEAKCVVLSSSMIYMSTTAISPGFAHKEINSVNCAPFTFLLLSEDLPSYLNTHVATLICRELEASSSSSQATSSSRCTLYNGMVLVLEVYNKPF